MSNFRRNNSLDTTKKAPCNPFGHLDYDKGDPFVTPEHEKVLKPVEEKTKSGKKIGR